MTDSYFNYDPSISNLASPQLFNNKSYQGYADQDPFQQEMDPQDQLHLYPHESEGIEQPDHRNCETLSNYSASSTNCSSKSQSQYLKYQEASNDQRDKKVIPIINKKIHKYYEPLLDGNIVYRYEDDPEEYKKARKRIQNRESASRVRSRKKNYIGDLEVEFDACKKENEELKVKNASLTAENNLLKQQIQFLEKMVMKSTGSQQYSEPEPSPMLPVTIKSEPPKTNSSFTLGVFRAAPAHTFKKHVGILSVVTIMICISYGIVARTPISTGGMMYPTGLSDFKSRVTFSPQSVDDDNGSSRTEMVGKLSSIFDELEFYHNLITTVKWVIMFGYFTYVGYILSITNWRNIFNSKKKRL